MVNFIIAPRCFYCFLTFSIAPFGRGAERCAPIIGVTCAFDAKIYKIVDGIFALSACVILDKNFFKFPILVSNYHRFWAIFRLNFIFFSLIIALELLFELLYKRVVWIYKGI